MKKEKKIKIFLATTYLVIILCFLWAFFNNFSLSEVTSYDFIKNNNEFFNEIREKNFLFISLLFLILTIIWVLLLGFGSPVIIVSGFIFGKWIGSLYAIFALTTGATLLYIFSNFFLKDLVEEKFSKKYSNLNIKFKNNEFNFFLIYRFIGGIPFFISNILPAIFNIKVKIFFYGTLLGMFPQVFLISSIGEGLNNVIGNNLQAPSIKQIIFSSDIYIPLISFVILIILGIFLKNIFYKK